MKQLFFIACLLACFSSVAQPIIDYPSFNQSTQSFTQTANDFLVDIGNTNPDDTLEGGERNALVRWTEFWNQRISNNTPTDSNKFFPAQNAMAYYLSNTWRYCSSDTTAYKGNWHCLGPFRGYYNVEERQGRIDAIWVDPNDSTFILVGANSGGIWKSTNEGQSWHCISDNIGTSGDILPGTLGVSSIAVDPTDRNTIYVGTGITIAPGNAMGLSYGMGVVYTTDGGNTWHKDNNFNSITQSGLISGYLCKKLIYRPGTQELFAISSNKAKIKSSSTWYNDEPPGISSNLEYTDVEFPASDQIAYSTTGENDTADLWIADYTSAQWIRIPFSFSSTFGLDNNLRGNQEGIIDISTPGNDTVYAIIKGHRLSDSMYQTFFYKTSISNPSWILVNSNPGNFNQIIVSPSNPNLVYLNSGYYPFKSTDGATSSINYIPGKYHMDCRSMFLYKSSTATDGIDDILYICTDGGIAKKKKGNRFPSQYNWDSLAITQFYSIANTEGSEKIMMAGAQDNGFFNFSKDRTTQWEWEKTGDGFIGKFAKNGLLKAYYEGNVLSFGLGQIDFSSSLISPGKTNPGNPNDYCYTSNDFVPCHNYQRPLFFDENQVGYAGLYSVWKRNINSGGSWARAFIEDPKEIVTNPFYKKVRDIVITKQDSNWVYLAYANNADSIPTGNSNKEHGRLFFSKNAHSATPIWINISDPLVQYYQIDDIEIDPEHPERIWVAYGNVGWAEQNYAPDTMKDRIRYSSDTGHTWSDVSHGLPALPINKILYQEGSDDILFAGTDIGIFRWNKSLQKWECFNQGMPACIVSDLEINYCSGRLRAATFGRGLWETNIGDIIGNPGASEIITGDIVWNSTKFVTGGVEIIPGSKLTISNTVVHMPKNGYILVDSGATLTIDTATITNSCETCLWGGIKIGGSDGHKDQNVLHHYHGGVYMRGAVIEHAVTAIENVNKNGTPTGGIVSAFNSKFLNNTRAVYLHHYTYMPSSNILWDNKSQFTDCEFGRDENYKLSGTSSSLKALVELNEVKNPRFSGCTFYNRQQSLSGVGSGILVTDGSVTVGLGTQRSLFTKLTNGIYTQNTVNIEIGTTDISNCNFDSCTYGIRSLNDMHTKMTNDSFKVGNGLDSYVGTDCHINIGIYSTNTRWQIVENNYFKGYTFTGQNAQHENWGVFMDNGGEEDKEVYRNTFEDLHKANAAWGVNRYLWTTNGHMLINKGLRYKCNTFINNGKDIYTTGDDPSNKGIAPEQASWDPYWTYVSSGNSFGSASTVHLENSGARYTYYYDGATTSNSKYPTPAKTISIFSGTNGWTGKIICTLANAANTCPYHYGLPLSGTDKGTLKSDFADAQSSALALRTSYGGLLDGGNTTDLKNYIKSKTIADSTEVRDALIGYSPYLSYDAIATAAHEDVLSDAKLIEVLEANPEVLRSTDILDYVQSSIPNTLSPSDVADILNTSGATFTARGDMEEQIAVLEDYMTFSANWLISDMLYDSAQAEADSIPVWYDNMNSLYAQYAKASFYATRGDYTTGDSVLSSIPTSFTLTTEQTTQHSQYTALWNIVKGIRQDGRSIADATTEEMAAIDSLNNIAAPYSIVYGATQSAGQLKYNNFGPCGNGLASWVNSSSEKPTRRADIQAKNKRVTDPMDKLTVYPNPAKDYVMFDYQFARRNINAKLIVTDVTGRVIQEFPINKPTGQYRWDTKTIMSGVYIFKIKTADAILQTGKVVISK